MDTLNFQVIDKRTNSLLLNGRWKSLVDADSRYTIGKIKEKLENGNSFPEMLIPSNWQLAGLDNFSGSVWFIKNFDFEPYEEVENIKILKFKGADYFTDVWINWNYLGRHEGYFQQFIFRLDENMLERNNILVIKITSPLEEPYKVWPSKKKLIKGIFNHHNCRPGGISYEHGQDQNTGGVWNDVLIQYGYPVYIENIKITSNINCKINRANLLFNIKYISSYTSYSKIPVDLEIISPSSQRIGRRIDLDFNPGVNELNYSIRIEEPDLWWCNDLGKPNLYEIKISSDFFEEQNLKYGIREVYLDEKKQFFLNGKRLFLRGTNIIPEQFLSGLSNEKILRIVGLIKEANINIVRVHAHVNREELYEEFDRQGILVWQDFSLQGTYDDSPEFIDNAVTQIKDMVRQLYNHASIVFWCCHNEPGKQSSTLDPFLVEAVKNEDNQRIIWKSSDYKEHAYDGWYWRNNMHFSHAPIGPLVTEFGAQALPNFISLKGFIPKNKLLHPDWKKWEYHNFQADQTFNIAKIKIGENIESFIINSQSYQANLLQTTVDFCRRKRFNGFTGIFQYMFIDCWPAITWSVVDYYFQLKKGYYQLKKIYQPLYISVDIGQEQYFAGKKFLFDICLINDFHAGFNNCKLSFYIDDKFYTNINNLSIKPDDLTFINYDAFDFTIPDDLKAGKYIMRIELTEENSGSVLSTNNFVFSIVECVEI